jgi:hypothetical protein
MSVTEADIAELLLKMDGWAGHKAWNVSLGVGSYVTMDFGPEIEITISNKHKFTRGKWHLWVQYCAWRIEARNKIVAGSDDPRYKLERAVKYFEGLVLKSVILTPPAPDVSFIFEKELILKLFPFNFTGDYEDWCLYTPDQHVLVLGGKEPWAYVSSSAGT